MARYFYDMHTVIVNNGDKLPFWDNTDLVVFRPMRLREPLTLDVHIEGEEIFVRPATDYRNSYYFSLRMTDRHISDDVRHAVLESFKSSEDAVTGSSTTNA